MSEHWNLILIIPKMLISFACPSKEHALSAAVDLCRSGNDEITLYVEGPLGQRIEQHEINAMHFTLGERGVERLV
jgi:hypothetical protein